MNVNLALLIAGTIFTFVGCTHFLRFFLKVEVIIAGKIIPYWVSIVAFILLFFLSYWMYSAASWNINVRGFH